MSLRNYIVKQGLAFSVLVSIASIFLSFSKAQAQNVTLPSPEPGSFSTESAQQETSLPTLARPRNCPPTQAQRIVVNFEDLTLAPNSFNNGSDGAGGFTSQCAFFNNSYNPTFDSWSGWSYSNTTDTTTPGFLNQYSAYTGGGFRNSKNYAVAFTFRPGGAYINLPKGFTPQSVRITNTTYAALSMLNGDQFAKKFGGVSGNDPDFFLLTITGLDASNNTVGTVQFYLADYRFADNSKDYIVNEWQRVNLSSLKGATKLSFALTSSDNDPRFGLNTPAYFAIDNLVLLKSDSLITPSDPSFNED